MDFDAIYNIVEIGLWAIIGLAFLIRAGLRPQFRNLALAVGIAFLLFGVSDIIELRTGSWWQPWWLFVLKAGCVVTFIISLTLFIRKKHQLTALDHNNE